MDLKRTREPRGWRMNCGVHGLLSMALLTCVAATPTPSSTTRTATPPAMTPPAPTTPLATTPPPTTPAATTAQASPNPKLTHLTQALIDGVHWGQVAMQLEEPRNRRRDAPLFQPAGMTLAEAKSLNALVDQLLAIPDEEFVAWASDATCPHQDEINRLVGVLDAHPTPDDPRLPVNLLAAYFAQRLAGPEWFYTHAGANLGQLSMQADKDATQLQQLFHLYIALGIHKLDIPAADDQQIADAKALAAESAPAPFGTGVGDYHIMLLKLLNWSRKDSGEVDRSTLGRQLLSDADIKPLIPALAALPPKRVAFLGHSLMMSLHWSTLGSWCDIAAETMKDVNPRFEYRDFQEGGMDPRRALKAELPGVLAYHPTDTYVLLDYARSNEHPALSQIVKELTDAGSEVYLVNDVRPFANAAPTIDIFLKALAKQPHVHFLDFAALARTAPGHEQWAAMDHIHMKTPGHIFMAKQLLKMMAEQTTR